MPQPAPYRSPLHNFVAKELAGTNVTLRDLCALPKLGVKGPGAEAWLIAQGIEIPPAIYDSRRLPDRGLIVRMGATDFFLEGDFLAHLAVTTLPAQVYRVERQDATFVLAGEGAIRVLAQLGSIDFRAAPIDRVCLTRVGGVSCAVLPEMDEKGASWRIWVDYTFAVSVWEILAEVCNDVESREHV